MDQEAASWRDWTNILGRVRFGRQTVAGKTISGTLIKAVAERVASYADGDGTRVHPGIARIAVDLESSYTTVRNAITILERVGLLRLVTPATRTHAAVYRLIIGEQLIEFVDVWSPARHKLEINRTAEKFRGQPQIADATGVSETAATLTPQESANDQDDHQIADATGSANPLTLTPQGVLTLTPEASATNHGPRHNYDQPTDEDARTAVTGPRARDPSIPPPRPLTAAEAARADARAKIAAARLKHHPEPASPTERRHEAAEALAAIDAKILDFAAAAATRTTQPATRPKEQPA